MTPTRLGFHWCIHLIRADGNDANILVPVIHAQTFGHGCNRGLWGKSNLYQESVHIPMIMAGPDVPVGECKTPVSLLDLAYTIPDHFGVAFDGRSSHQPLHDVIAAMEQPDRPILSQYHAAGAVSGAYMYKKGRWKLNY